MWTYCESPGDIVVRIRKEEWRETIIVLCASCGDRASTPGLRREPTWQPQPVRSLRFQRAAWALHAGLCVILPLQSPMTVDN